MALKNSITGEYHKVVDLVPSPLLEETTIMVEAYANEEHRQNGDSEFLKHQDLSVDLKTTLKEVALKHVYDDSLGYNNMIVALYNHVKSLPEYEGWVDC